MPLELEVYGTNKLMARLVKLPKSLDLASAEGIKEVAELIRDHAKAICPVDTGSLRASIRKQVYASPATHIHRVGVSAGGYKINPKTGRRVDYASFVEFGTSRMRAQPYMRPAMERYKDKLPKIVKANIRK